MSSPNPLPLQIDIVSDIVCPWCVLGFKQLEAALERVDGLFAVTLRWHPFELNPQLPADGEDLREHLARKMGASPDGGNAIRERLGQLGDAVGFKFNFSAGMRISNTFSAHQLLHWSRHQGRETDLTLALFRSYFSEHRNLNDVDTLGDIAASVGLDREEAMTVIADQRYAEDVRAEERVWLDRDVTAVPAFFFEKTYPVPGAQDIDTFERILRRLHDVKSAA